MSDLESRLRAALAGRYAVTREIGRGGMAVVFLARDERHERDVAVKVLSPELAAALGSDRFLREIRVAARLNHPGILALHDSGEADGLLYYVMPFVEGESLAARLRREHQLSIEDAIRIGAEVAEALDYAGKQGIVHRDIKPGNILLAGAHAIVADFGLAHALEQDQAVLTSSGLVVGTPMYMSPEQVGSSAHLDPRSDQYSLGCVVYEMLVGEPPFTGASLQHVFARHAAERVPSIRAVRDTVPPEVEAAVHRTMAKNPADRFPASGVFAQALRGEPVPSWSRTSLVANAPRPRRRWVISAMAAGAAIVALGVWRLVAGGPPSLPVQDDQLAVLPLMAANTADSGLAATGITLANLLADRFTGLGGPRAVDPSSVRSAISRTGKATAALGPRDVVAIARSVGSAGVVRGQVLSDGNRLLVSASIESPSAGDVLARASSISGSSDSLPQLADRLAAALLASLAHQPADRLPALQRAKLPAVRSFLAAESEFSSGQLTEALSRYKEAIGQDSTLLVAAIGWELAAELAYDPDRAVADTLLKRHAASLPATDLRFLPCLVKELATPAIPDSVRYYQLCQTAAASSSGRPDIWFQFGWMLMQEQWAGLAGVEDRAAAAYRQALAQDPGYVPALGHLLDIEAQRGDTAEVRRLGARYFALDTSGDLAQFYRWLVAASLNDTAELGHFRAQLQAQSTTTLDRLISAAQLEGIRLDDAEAAAAELKRQSGVTHDLARAYQRLQELALNRGRPGAAAAVAVEAENAQAGGLYTDFGHVFAALYWDADTLLAARTVERIERGADSLAAGRSPPSDRGYLAVCAVGLWRASHGNFTSLPQFISTLGHARDAGPGAAAVVCGQALAATMAVMQRHPDAAARLAELDSPWLADPGRSTWAITLGNLTLARLYSQRGNYAAALAAVRRRAPLADVGSQRILVALSTLLREEGRLARMTGNVAEAREAYARYTALRADAEPSLRGGVEKIRSEMAELE